MIFTNFFSDYSKNIVENITETADHFNSFQFWRDPIPDFDEQEIYPNDVVSNVALIFSVYFYKFCQCNHFLFKKEFDSRK